MSPRSLPPLLLTILTAASCNWLSLAKNALTYREVQRGQTANIAVTDSVLYATMADDGLAIVNGRSGQTLATLVATPGQRKH